MADIISTIIDNVGELFGFIKAFFASALSLATSNPVLSLLALFIVFKLIKIVKDVIL
jgi:hypothetical protein